MTGKESRDTDRTYPGFVCQHSAKPYGIKEGSGAQHLRWRKPGQLLSKGCEEVHRVCYHEQDGVWLEGPHGVDDALNNPHFSVHMLYTGFTWKDTPDEFAATGHRLGSLLCIEFSPSEYFDPAVITTMSDWPASWYVAARTLVPLLLP